jgi:type II secretory pathway pseudopilin PulG
MLKFIILKTKRHRKDQGFTMLEVLVAGLIAFFFIIGSLQAMVLATMLRVQSLEKERANELIQEDKEAVKALATNFQIPNTANLSNLCAPNDPANGFAQLFSTSATGLQGLAVPDNKKVLSTYSDTSATAPGRTLLLTRIPTVGTTAPFKTLIINYQVDRTIDGTNPDLTDLNRLIATDTLEVMPNVALQCP